jgi:hypothetical protein
MSIADNYLDALPREKARVRESLPPDNELAWQARWFSGACGRDFTASGGEKVTILDFGEWNREAGPDFVRATVRINGRNHQGSIEVDLDASGWEQHGHATNPAYTNVVLHVVVGKAWRRHFSRNLHHQEITQICLQDHASAASEWNTSANARPGRCTSPLRVMDPDRLSCLLEVAARRRLAHKGSVLQNMISSRGEDAALYEAIAVTLGYKNNKLPFQLLAQRVPRRLAAKSGGEALVFGLAGFLERPQPPAGPAKAEITSLWSTWWKQRASCERAILPRGAWQLSGVRPANHPLRRLGALAAIARRWSEVLQAVKSADWKSFAETLSSLDHEFWSYHTTWQSRRRKIRLALLGTERIRDIYANVALPLAISRGSASKEWLELPAGPPNTTLRIVTARLFSGSLPRHLPRRLYVNQGLLQIYADFCLRDHHECVHCGFPALVKRLSA